MAPELSEVIAFIREYTGNPRRAMDASTLLEADLGVCGDDGVELLEDIAKAFNVELCTDEEGYRKTFSLQENEYLFSSEGLDLLGIGRLIDWLRKIPPPVIRDLSIGQLHSAIVEAARLRS